MKITKAFVNAQRAHRARRAGEGQRPTTENGAGTAPTPQRTVSSATATAAPRTASEDGEMVDLMRRRDALTARVAELQWDLGGLAYEMAIRNRIRVDVLVKRAATLQDADAELSEIERIVRLEQTGTAGVCGSCGAPHSSGAVFCWQCGTPFLERVASDAIAAP
jgi:chorismate mutase